ncbi:carboxypeptidase-like regulatory domain-containing protein [Mesonia sp. K7]|uniref:carboxypeptidase-like regulatory domain-containing protein n=1 Tax=Mesonia sp. K7 TaxID=2218606 RepID=UPI000DA98799|nr:carboxypeptidase-like regulatory domain-containing protein [Mesonia sp. K7]PZD78705.1 carboxypeptidase-like regulatory domain-containing protein [Mesonia sp. K7]
MKTKYLQPVVCMVFIFFMSFFSFAQENYKTIQGKVVNQETNSPVEAVQVQLNDSDYATITNKDGEFTIKIPAEKTNSVISFNALGFDKKAIHLSYLNEEENIIKLMNSARELQEVNLYFKRDAEDIIKKCFAKKGDNYIDNPVQMTAFYRETIAKGNRNVSLSEAIVNINKSGYNSSNNEDISLYKARKSTDYDRLDTLALKFRGGPYSSLYLDVMAYPENLFDGNQFQNYTYTLDIPTEINNRLIHKVNFEENNKGNTWYSGNLYVDAQTYTLVRAEFQLNIEDRKKAANLFVHRKPGKVKVYPDLVAYEINYFEKNGKWYYGHGNIHLDLTVDWKKKLFNSHYTVKNEMLVTNWDTSTEMKGEAIKPSIVMTDDVSGFKDENFWGENNIIEPDKSIENAIEKIRKNLPKY